MSISTLKRMLCLIVLAAMPATFEAVASMATESLYQDQRVKISGKVATRDGKGAIGVTVLVKDTHIGTGTDHEGNFTLDVPRNSVIVFSLLGYKTQEIDLGNQTIIDVTLEEDSEILDDVVVIGYGVQRKSDVTGAISQVKPEDMINRSITRPEQALQGKTAGVQLITTTGTPGSAPAVRIRGLGSNYSSSPLYVVDGLRVSDIGGIDPNNIESMEVLKDAASAAIYGAEAGNGVILVTTKRGRSGHGNISYDFQYAVQSLAKTPRLLNASEYIDYMVDGGYIQQPFIDANWDGTTDTNWLDVAFGNSIMQRHNIQFQGANDRGSYFLSLSYLDNDGIIRGKMDTYKRLTATINGDYKVKPWLRVGTTTNIERWSQKAVTTTGEYGGLLTAAILLDPLTPDTYSADNLPAFMGDIIDNGFSLLQNNDGDYYAVSQFYSAENYHPMIMRDRNVNSNTNFNVSGTVYGDFTPIKNLTITSRLGYRLGSSGSNSFSKPYYGSAVANSKNISADASTSSGIYYLWENFANYVLVKNKHNMGAMVGTSFSENYSFGLSGSVDNVLRPDNPAFWYISAQTKDAVKTISGGTPTYTRKLSYFGRLSYNYNEKYILQASFRADAADLSVLSNVQRWGYFPSVSAGWVISNESFFQKQNNPVTYAKIRASWGQNGSTSMLGGYQWLSSISSDYWYIFNSSSLDYTTGSGPNRMGNDNLKWETHEQINIGFDTRFFRDRLTFTFDWFQKKTKDLIVSGATPSLTIGNTSAPINAGNIENKGFEFELGWRDRVGDFSYGVNANLATLKNKVTYIHPTVARINGASYHTYTGLSAFEVGYPAWYFRGYEFTGIDPDTGEPTFKTGNADGVVTDGDITMIGDPTPDFTYGITISAAWKGVDLVVFGTGSQGNDMYMCLTRTDRAESNRMYYLYEDRWTPTNTTGTKPKAGFINQEQYLTSSAMVFDGSYFKIKQIQLGYTLPKNWTRKFFVENFRVYASLDDFITFTKYPGFDPEVSVGSTSSMGFDKGNYPISKKIVFGLNLTF